MFWYVKQGWERLTQMQQFSTGYRKGSADVQFWGKVEKKREKNEEQKYRQNP
jgi:hypothetical protein